MDSIAKLSCCSKLARDSGLVATTFGALPAPRPDVLWAIGSAEGKTDGGRRRARPLRDGVPALIAKRNDWTSSQVLLARVAAGEGDELVESAGVDGYWHGRVESGADAALFIERLARQAEDVSGVSVGDSELAVQRYGEIPAVDHEFELQDAQRKMCGQYAACELHIVGQPAAAPARQDRLCDLSDALIDGLPLGDWGFDARGGA